MARERARGWAPKPAARGWRTASCAPGMRRMPPGLHADADAGADAQTAISSRTPCASISLPAPPATISPRLITQ
ncbi:hypothetical protein BW21_1045 [Burkholderia humptydooensis]|nr:hypothetical protein BW21_1045 [Burkholderia sp. 2002721687]